MSGLRRSRSLRIGVVAALAAAGIAVAAAPVGAESTGCRIVNQVFGRGVTGMSPTIGSASFDAGDRLTLTVSGAQDVTPSDVTIRRQGVVVASAPYPGPATWIVPTTGTQTSISFETAPVATATFRMSCVAGPPPAPPADVSPPTVELIVAGDVGNDGWYVSDVVVSWAVGDSESPVLSQVGCGPTVVSFDTPGLPLTCTATSAGGSASQHVTIRRDATPPVVAPVVTPDPVLLRGGAHADAGASDEMSGVHAAVCDEPDTSSAGVGVVQCAAADVAGNAAAGSVNFTVAHDFRWLAWDGEAKAGSAVPLRWSLGDAAGAPVDGVVPTVRSAPCGAAASEGSVTESVPGSARVVQPEPGSYMFVWKAPRAYAGTCRRVEVDTGDGAAHAAHVRFR